jgi:hypothetical protein
MRAFLRSIRWRSAHSDPEICGWASTNVTETVCRPVIVPAINGGSGHGQRLHGTETHVIFTIGASPVEHRDRRPAQGLAW